MWWDVKVGDQVVCIDGKPSNERRYTEEKFPEEGKVYTVREIIDNPKGLSIRLNEIRNPVLLYKGGVTEIRFYLWRFRPIQKKHKGMETLTSILLKPGQEIKGFEQSRKKITEKV